MSRNAAAEHYPPQRFEQTAKIRTRGRCDTCPYLVTGYFLTVHLSTPQILTNIISDATKTSLYRKTTPHDGCASKTRRPMMVALFSAQFLIFMNFRDFDVGTGTLTLRRNCNLSFLGEHTHTRTLTVLFNRFNRLKRLLHAPIRAKRFIIILPEVFSRTAIHTIQNMMSSCYMLISQIYAGHTRTQYKNRHYSTNTYSITRRLFSPLL